MPLTSGELAGGKLLLFIALHSSSLALEKDGLSLTGGAKETEREQKKRVVRKEVFFKERGDKRVARAVVTHASIGCIRQ